MWVHGAAIAGVVLGCAAWAMFQIWLEKRDPACRFRAGCCGGKECKEKEEFTAEAQRAQR